MLYQWASSRNALNNNAIIELCLRCVRAVSEYAGDMTTLGPYSRPKAIAQMDGRTREAKLLRETRADLIAHLGGTATATQRALIDRAAWLTLHVAQLDARTAEGKAMTEHDSRHYLAWSNSLTRTLSAIGLKGTARPAKTLQQHVAERAAVSQ